MTPGKHPRFLNFISIIGEFKILSNHHDSQWWKCQQRTGYARQKSYFRGTLPKQLLSKLLKWQIYRFLKFIKILSKLQEILANLPYEDLNACFLPCSCFYFSNYRSHLPKTNEGCFKCIQKALNFSLRGMKFSRGESHTNDGTTGFTFKFWVWGGGRMQIRNGRAYEKTLILTKLMGRWALPKTSNPE